MDNSVEHLNLDYYRKRLVTETDSTIRQILIRLIAEEEARAALVDETQGRDTQKP